MGSRHELVFLFRPPPQNNITSSNSTTIDIENEKGILRNRAGTANHIIMREIQWIENKCKKGSEDVQYYQKRGATAAPFDLVHF
jgi:hypothetical protein